MSGGSPGETLFPVHLTRPIAHTKWQGGNCDWAIHTRQANDKLLSDRQRSINNGLAWGVKELVNGINKHVISVSYGS